MMAAGKPRWTVKPSTTSAWVEVMLEGKHCCMRVRGSSPGRAVQAGARSQAAALSACSGTVALATRSRACDRLLDCGC